VPVVSPGQFTASGQTRIPKVIGGFELVSKLGQGGMGAVFQARQVSMDRLVALKLLPPALARDGNFIERFQREARASALICHPNLVQGIDVGQDEASGLWYFAMEYVPGESLRALLRREGRLDERRALAIARDVAAGLAAAHHAGVVHRDIKPDNIMLTPGGGAKILDLGLAKTEQDDSSLTQTGTSLGTPLYMAPEQARGELNSLNASTDLYALGATLFHLIAGHPPFEGQTSAVILAQHLTKPAPKLDQVAPETSHVTSVLVARMMAKDQDQRPASAGEVVKRIEDILAGRVSDPGHSGRAVHATHATHGPRDHGEGRTEPPRSARSPTLLVAGGAVVVAVVVAVALMIGGGTPPPKSPPVPQLSAPASPSRSAPATSVASAGPAVVVAPAAPASATGRIELERAFTHAVDWAERNPDRHDEATAMFRKVAGFARGTPAEAEFADRVAQALAGVEQRRSRAADAAWTAIETRATAAATAGRHTAALAAAAELPPGMGVVLAERSRALTARLRAQAQAAVDVELATATAAAKAGDAAALAAASARLAAIDWPEGAAPAQATLVALTQTTAQAEQNARVAVARTWTEVADSLVTALLAGEWTAARERADALRREHPALGERLDRVGAVLLVVGDRDQALVEALTAQRGKPIALATRKRGQVRGVVDEVTSKAVRMTMELGDGAQAKLTLAFEDLTAAESERLIAGTWKPQSADDRVHVALAAVRSEAKTADSAIAALGDHPLADALRRRLTVAAPATVVAKEPPLPDFPAPVLGALLVRPISATGAPAAPTSSDLAGRPLGLEGVAVWAADPDLKGQSEVLELRKGAVFWPHDPAFDTDVGSALILVRWLGGDGGLFGKGVGGGAGESQWDLMIWAGQLATASGWPRAPLPWEIGVPVALNRWMTAAMTWNAREARYYIDGRLRLTRPWSVPLRRSSGRIEVGVNSPGGIEFLHGRVGWFGAYTNELTEAQVQAAHVRLTRTLLKDIMVAPPAPPGAVYLADLEPVEEIVMRKFPRGQDWMGAPIQALGTPAPKSILAHPVTTGSPSRLIYKLPPGTQVVSGRCGIGPNVSKGPVAGPLTFVVLADGREIWRSMAIQQQHALQDFHLAVTGVQLLELRVECPGSYMHAQSIWYEPWIGGAAAVAAGALPAGAAPARTTPFPTSPALQLVLWNTHNGTGANAGTLLADISFFNGVTLVGSLPDQALPWSPTLDMSQTFPVPAARFDRVRVDVKRWQGVTGGLSEIQLLFNGRNVLQGATVRASGAYGPAFAANRVTDGITTSAVSGRGFWLLPIGVPAWVEVMLPP